jgi:hypothetical protein
VSVAPGASVPPLAIKGEALGEWGDAVDLGLDVVGTGDVNAQNNSTDLATPIQPPVGLAIAVDDGGVSVVTGATVTYTVSVSNVGTDPSDGPVTVAFSASGVALTGSGTGWQCAAASCVTTARVPAGGALPPVRLTGSVTALDEAGVIVTLDNDTDETAGDDIDGDTTPVVAQPPPSTTTTTVAPAPGTTTTTTPALPSLWVNDVTVTEPNSSTTPAAFTVTLSRAATTKVTVNYVTVAGSAVTRQDFSRRSDTLAFLPGERTKTIAVPVKGDVKPEPTEQFQLALAKPVGATIARGTAVATVLDND